MEQVVGGHNASVLGIATNGDAVTLWDRLDRDRLRGPIRDARGWGGLRPDGELALTPELEPGQVVLNGDLSERWLAVGGQTNTVVVDARHRLHLGGLDGGEAYPVVLRGQPVAAAGATFGQADHLGGCALDETGYLGCFGDRWVERFQGDGWVMFDGDRGQACGVRDDYRSIICLDGQEFDFGPVRQLAAAQRLGFNDSSRFCVLTLDNTIHCVGHDEALQEQLDALNEEFRVLTYEHLP